MITPFIWTSKPFDSSSILSLTVEVARTLRVYQGRVKERSREVTAPGHVWRKAGLTSESKIYTHRMVFFK